MKFALSVTLSALALASRTFAADLEDRSYHYSGQQQQQQGQEQGTVRTTTVHDTMVSTTTATRFITVTMGAQEQAVCTSSAVYQTPVFVTSSVEAQSPPPQETTLAQDQATTTQETSSMHQQQSYGNGNMYQTTTVAAQEQPAMTTETVTSTKIYETTVTWATPTTVTQMEQGTTVVHTVDVTLTSTRRVTETELVTRTKTKTRVVHETQTRTAQAQQTGGAQYHHNNGNGHGNGNANTSAGTTITTNTVAAETTTSSAANVADVTTSAAGNTNTNVATVTDIQTSTFLVTTTVDGLVSTETGTSTVSAGANTTTDGTTSSTSAAATIADASPSSASSTSDVGGTIADATTSADPADNTGDPQTSTTLDPRVIEDGFAQDGQDPPVTGQVPSLTSTNNYINFCLTQSGVPLTDGQQIRTGSCNPVPQGSIIAKNKIPSAKFVFPLNFGKIPANQPFTAKLKIKNLQAGAFTNAQLTYYAAPAQVNGDGVLIGHSHLVIEQLRSLDDTEPLDPTTFAFFKGLNAPLDGDSTLSATLDKGLPAGVYRMFSINTAANHQPALASVAQHGSMDDGVYFTAE